MAFSNKTFKVHKQRIILPNYIKLHNTIDIYQKVIKYLLPKVATHISEVQDLKNLEKQRYFEKLVHKTKNNVPLFLDFDELFKNFPSYFRRTAITDTIGIVESFNTRFEDYLQDKRDFELNPKNKGQYHIKPPTFSLEPNQFPILYKGNMFQNKDGEISIKTLFNDNNYQWIKTSINDRSSKNFLKELDKYKVKSPKLVRKGKKFFLYFLYEKTFKYEKQKTIIKNTKNGIKLNNLNIFGIDLGINTDAVCSLINSKGTVLDKLFVNFSREKGLIRKLVQKKNKQYSKTNTKKDHRFSKINRKISNQQKNLTSQIVFKLFSFIKENNVDMVVMENLDNFLKVKERSKKEKFHYWNKISVQNKLIEKLKSVGIRYRKVNPYNTSKIAFDGTGLVKRPIQIKNESKKNYSLCKFTSGKIYNSDLNASYNIASRFIFNELTKLHDNKLLNLKEFQQFQAEVLELFSRTTFCLSSVWKINKLLSKFYFSKETPLLAVG